MAEGQGACLQVELRRLDTSQSWGFRLKGGADQGIPLYVEQVGLLGLLSHACAHVTSYEGIYTVRALLTDFVYTMTQFCHMYF